MTQFPEIRTIDDVLPALKDHPEFAIKDQGDYVAIDYNYAEPGTFDDPIRRECRGIKFAKSGELIARPYHKFFNIGEKEETQPDAIDWSLPHVVLEKLDGSMVHPVSFDGETIRWMTRAGETDISAQAAAYATGAFSEDQWDCLLDTLDGGWTPIFEWCSPQNQIVIRYPENKLVLTALRHNQSGVYGTWVAGTMPHEVKMWGHSVGELDKFLAHACGLEDKEGYVVRFTNGFMVKVKADAYVLRHKARDSLLLEKNVLRMVLENATDDVLPLLALADADRLKGYAWDVRFQMGTTACALADHVAYGKTLSWGDRKTFATKFAPRLSPLMKGMAFRVLDGAEPHEVVRDCILRHCGSSTGVDTVRDLIGGARWQ